MKTYRICKKVDSKIINEFDNFRQAQNFIRGQIEEYYILDKNGYDATYGISVKELKEMLNQCDEKMEVRFNKDMEVDFLYLEDGLIQIRLGKMNKVN